LNEIVPLSAGDTECGAIKGEKRDLSKANYGDGGR
jgi:hypothetical protein